MKTDLTIIDVAVALPIAHTFSYTVPEILLPFVSAGKRVLVPFGKRRVTGYVLGKGEYSDQYEIKAVLDVLDETPLFPETMIPFFRWISEYYMYPLGEVIRNALPGGLNIYDLVLLEITVSGQAAISGTDLTPLQREILTFLNREPCRLKQLSKLINRDIPNALIRTMENSGWIARKRELSGKVTRSLTERWVRLNAKSSFLHSGSDIPFDKLSESKKKVIRILRSEGEISVKNLKAEVPSASSAVKSLEQSGYVSIFEKNVYRNPFGETVTPDIPRILNAEQNSAVSQIMNALGKGFSAFLLAGVTGSGKTEVYLHVASEVIRRGQAVLVLVPEIALISQMETRFRARFGESVAILHSGISRGERYDQWMRILRNEAGIAVGARSAIFAPFEHIGLIIADEEHDPSYKQENDLLYNARDLALVRAKLLKTVAVLGSATPSVQSCFNAESGKLTELTLSRRVENRPLPEIHLVDLRNYRDEKGIRKFISPELHSAMKDTLARGEQVLLFLNRRGFAGFPVCAACGDAIGCEHCDITLTFHRADDVFKCHYCGFSLSRDSGCPTCGSRGIIMLGIGTEKLEASVKSLFPDARVARMDRDTVSHKHALSDILKDVRNHQTDILVGTQMVAKGHDFPMITLVGIICADLSLSFPDFRAAERTFQLLAQVSGRAGRGDVPGKVILQTYNPDHFSIISAMSQDFRAFYAKEIEFRKALGYPPFSRLVQLRISGKDKKITASFAKDIGEFCRNLHKSDPLFSNSVKILGPIEASISKVAGDYRWQILLKGRSVTVLHRFVRCVTLENQSVINNRKVKVTTDADPFFMF